MRIARRSQRLRLPEAGRLSAEAQVVVMPRVPLSEPTFFRSRTTVVTVALGLVVATVTRVEHALLLLENSPPTSAP